MTADAGSDQPLRVTFVAQVFPSPDDPVAGVYHYKRAQALARSANLTVICLSPAYRPWTVRQPLERLAAAGNTSPPLPVHRIKYPSLVRLSRSVNAMLAQRALAPTLAATAPQVVVSYWLYPEGFAATNAARELGVPAIAGVIGSDLRMALGPFAKRRARRALHAADHVVTVSEELRQKALDHGLRPDAVTAVRNGCDSAVFRPASREEARRHLGLPPDVELVLFVGRLVAAKGLRELFAAAASLARERPLLKVAILGDGPLRHELERQAQRSGAGENVLMRGPRPPTDVARWLAAADLLCLPSYSEGCPNVVLEALSCGRPVVASAVGGVPELVAEDCAVLVPPADSQALTAGLRIALTRRWDEKLIASRHTRRWEDVGHEVYQLCLRVARAGGRTQPPVPPAGR